LFDVDADSAVASTHAADKIHPHGEDFSLVGLVVLQVQIIGEHGSETVSMVIHGVAHLASVM
jgi:hypothetical protein